jgi:hypothetical protein
MSAISNLGVLTGTMDKSAAFPPLVVPSVVSKGLVESGKQHVDNILGRKSPAPAAWRPSWRPPEDGTAEGIFTGSNTHVAGPTPRARMTNASRNQKMDAARWGLSPWRPL